MAASSASSSPAADAETVASPPASVIDALSIGVAASVPPAQEVERSLETALHVRVPAVLDTVREKQQTQPPTDASVLEDVVLNDWEGHPVRLGDLWSERPAVLVFVRHFGCVFCRQMAVDIHRQRDKFEEADVELAVIGHGSPAHAADFRKLQNVDLRLLVDPDRKVYELAGAKVATLNELIGPRQILRGLRATVDVASQAGQHRGAPGAGSSATRRSSAECW